jgi:hypothetical protein
MYYVIGTCILIALAAYYIVYLLGKKSGRQEWIIEQNKMKNYYAKKDRKRFNENMGANIVDALNGLRKDTHANP